MIWDEIDIMRRCKYLNIVWMYEDYDLIRYIYFVMELIKGGDFFDVILLLVKFIEIVIKNYVKDIVRVLVYLYKRKIVYRDLKFENLLVSNKVIIVNLCWVMDCENIIDDLFLLMLMLNCWRVKYLVFKCCYCVLNIKVGKFIVVMFWN